MDAKLELYISFKDSCANCNMMFIKLKLHVNFNRKAFVFYVKLKFIKMIFSFDNKDLCLKLT